MRLASSDDVADATLPYSGIESSRRVGVRRKAKKLSAAAKMRTTYRAFGDVLRVDVVGGNYHRRRRDSLEFRGRRQLGRRWRSALSRHFLAPSIVFQSRFSISQRNSMDESGDPPGSPPPAAGNGNDQDSMSTPPSRASALSRSVLPEVPSLRRRRRSAEGLFTNIPAARC